MRVVIVGIGDIGLGLAKNLARRKNCELVLIDMDEKKCNEVAADLDALVLCGDGSDPEILKKAQLAKADALVAATGSDPINTVIAMLAHRFSVGNIIVKLTDVGLRSACREIGVSRIIAPKIAAVSEIISTLFGFDRVNFASVASGGLRLIEFEIHTTGVKRISELEVPVDAHIVAVMRGESMLIPKANLKLEEGDQLLLLVEDTKVLDRLREQLAKN